MDTSSIVAIAIISLFFLIRVGFTGLLGKRSRTDRLNHSIRSGRAAASILAMLLIPGLEIAVLDQYAVLILLRDEGLAITLGGALSFFGLLLMLSTRMHRYFDWGFMGDVAGSKLFVRGPYSLVRHPYYTGAFLCGVGLYLVLNTWLILISIPVGHLLYRAMRAEDAYLKQAFGDDWRVYKKRVIF